jgi:DNA-binding transcriptional MerR regulator
VSGRSERAQSERAQAERAQSERAQSESRRSHDAQAALGLEEGRTAARPDKAAGAFRTISEVSEELDVPAHVLRFWESKFPQVSPMKRGGGRRYYRPADVALLRGVRRMLYEDGLTIKGLQKILRERGPRHVAALGSGEPPSADEPAVSTPPGPRPEGLLAIVARLEAVRDSLRD